MSYNRFSTTMLKRRARRWQLTTDHLGLWETVIDFFDITLTSVKPYLKIFKRDIATFVTKQCKSFCYIFNRVFSQHFGLHQWVEIFEVYCIVVAVPQHFHWNQINVKSICNNMKNTNNWKDDMPEPLWIMIVEALIARSCMIKVHLTMIIGFVSNFLLVFLRGGIETMRWIS